MMLPLDNTFRRRLLAYFGPAVYSVALLFTGTAHAQSADEKPGDDVYKLSPFEVNSTRDVGYQAKETLAGSRTATPLRDLANPVDVFTKELMDDLAVNDIQDLTLFASGVEKNSSGDLNSSGEEIELWNYNYMVVRGFKTGVATRNFMPLLAQFESYNAERVTFSKGPNAVLFGLGNAGGAADYTTKTPMLYANRYSASFVVDSVGTFRNTLDLNQTLIKDVLAVRLNTLYSRMKYTEDASYYNDKGIDLTLKYKPFERTTINVGYEVRSAKRAMPSGVIPRDYLSNYVDAGSPLVTAVDDPAKGNLTFQDGTVATSPGDYGLGITSSKQLVIDGMLQSMTRIPYTQSSKVNGETPTIDLDRYGYSELGNIRGVNNFNFTDWTITEMSLTHQVTDNFYVELTYAKSLVESHQAGSVGRDLYIDPVGYGDNAHAGQMFSENWPFRIDRYNDIEHYRATASYDMNFTEVSPWLGRHNLAVLVERDNREEVWDHGRLTLTQTPDGPIDPFADFGSSGWRNSKGRVYIRSYLDFANGNYSQSDQTDIYFHGFESNGYKAEMLRVTGWVPKHSLTRQDSVLAALQSHFWQDRIITTVGYRDDKRDTFSAAFGERQVEYNGQMRGSGLYGPLDLRPGAPADSLDPWDGRLPQDGVTDGGISRNYGLVLTPRPWDWISFTYNRASNFSPQTESKGFYGDYIPSSTGKSQDYGIRLYLLHDRVSVDLVRYHTQELDSITTASSVDSPQGTLRTIEDILVENGIRTDNPIADGGDHTTSDRDGKGEELTVTANLGNWNLRVTGSRSENRLTNIAPEVKKYWASNVDFYRAQDPSLTLAGSTTTLGEYLDSAATDIGLLRARENVVSFPSSKYILRTTAKYNFPQGILGGFAIGGSTRWNSAPVIGYYKQDNSSFDTSREYKGDSYFRLDLFLIYQRRLWGHVDWKLQLNINNVLDDTTPYPTAAINSADSPDFSWIVTRLRPEDGRLFKLTSTFMF